MKSNFPNLAEDVIEIAEEDCTLLAVQDMVIVYNSPGLCREISEPLF